MRFLRNLFLLVLVVAVLAVGTGLWLLQPYGPGTETFVDIAPGTGTPGIAAQLQAAGIIRSRYAFEALRWMRGGSLKAGEYRFDHPAKLTEIYARIHKGDVYTRTLLVPEGFNIFEIAQAVQAAGLGSRETFLQAAQKHTELIAKWSPNAPSLEGYLFPDTYRFSRHATPFNMLSTMVKRFGQEATVLGLHDADVARTVTMASMVEKEVHLDTERSVVAGVFENRLAAGMPLQTDPTVAYASLLNGTWNGVIHQSELHSDSAYNTYIHPGLPPGPICNPGIAALKAAMHPVKTDYLYFVADATGGTRFSTTLGEHVEKVKGYRKQEAGSRK
ncbi:MAG TPA: endolytic transglycosylase MltG [Acidobacteriaceae bacterium]